MKFWIWHRPPNTGESQEAIRQADRAMVDAENRDDAVKQVAEESREIRERNHFREAVEDTMTRRKPA